MQDLEAFAKNLRLSDFIDFCESKGDERYNYIDNSGCAIAQFIQAKLGTPVRVAENYFHLPESGALYHFDYRITLAAIAPIGHTFKEAARLGRIVAKDYEPSLEYSFVQTFNWVLSIHATARAQHGS